MQTCFIFNSKKVKPDVRNAVVIKPKGIPTANAQICSDPKAQHVVLESQGQARKKSEEAQDKLRLSNYVNTLFTSCKLITKHLWVFVPTCD